MLLLSACRTELPQTENQTKTREVTDDLGRNVRVPERIERAISLAPSLTEMIFAIGAGDRLVGVTTYCDFPPEAQAIQKVSDTQTPNIENIVALNPEVVLVTTASQLEAFMKTLEEQGIAVYVTNPTNLDGVFRNLVQLGDLFEQTERAEDLALSLSRRVSYVTHQTSYQRPPAAVQRERPRVFFQISNEPLFTIGKDSFLTEIVESAGGVLVTKNVATAYPKLSKETALALNPGVIILSDSEDNREPNDVFRNSPAVKNGRVIRVNPDLISRPGPRLIDALEQIARELQQNESPSE